MAKIFIVIFISIFLLAGFVELAEEFREYQKKINIYCKGKIVVECTLGRCKEREGNECQHEK